MELFKKIGFFILIITSVNWSYSQGFDQINAFDNPLSVIKNEVKLYPNPVTGDYLEVSVTNSTTEEFSLIVHNIIGNVVDVKMEQVGTGKYRLNLQDLVSGYYFVAVKSDQYLFNKTYKFLKK